MKRFFATIILILIGVCTIYCAFAETTDEHKWTDEEIIEALISEPWLELYTNDEYVFSLDGKATHNNSSVKYSVADGIVTIAEGPLGKMKYALTFDASDDIILLVTADEDCFLRKTDHEVVSAELQSEYAKALAAPEAWTVRQNGRFSAYYMFLSNGTGWVLFTNKTIGMTWSFIDNHTIKLVANGYGSTTLEIIDKNGTISLVAPNATNVSITPKK